MRKKTMKLSLHRETLRQLDPLEALNAVGGNTTSQGCIFPSGCVCGTGQSVGPTWEHTCGTTCDVPTGAHQCPTFEWC